MCFRKFLTATAALASFSVGATVWQPLSEEQLSEFTGQAIAILIDVDVNIGSAVYTDINAGHHGSIIFGDVNANGLFALTLDSLSSANVMPEFIELFGGPSSAAAITVLGAQAGLSAVSGTAFSTGFYDGSDVIKLHAPDIGIADNNSRLLDLTIGSIRMGNGAASFGGLALNNINLQGTTAYLWAH